MNLSGTVFENLSDDDKSCNDFQLDVVGDFAICKGTVTINTMVPIINFLSSLGFQEMHPCEEEDGVFICKKRG